MSRSSTFSMACGRTALLYNNMNLSHVRYGIVTLDLWFVEDKIDTV